MPEIMPFGMATNPSDIDGRTVQFAPNTLTGLFTKGGVPYLPEDIESQDRVGICTGISEVQRKQKEEANKYSWDFQYLLQKLFIDKNWNEGSSLLAGLRIANKYGFLPRHLWTYTTQADLSLPYAQYIAKLQAIPMSEVQRLISFCVGKIPGYAQVNVNDPMALAKAIAESKAGILCRFEVGKEWFTPSQLEKDINPIQPPKEVISGHAIIMSEFDFTDYMKMTVANTWGVKWCRKGCGDIDWNKYRPTEAWVILDKQFFVNDLKLGMTHPDVKRLQVWLNTHGFPVAVSGAGSLGSETEFYGTRTQQAVAKFQAANKISPAAGYFGVITRTYLNSII